MSKASDSSSAAATPAPAAASASASASASATTPAHAPAVPRDDGGDPDLQATLALVRQLSGDRAPAAAAAVAAPRRAGAAAAAAAAADDDDPDLRAALAASMALAGAGAGGAPAAAAAAAADSTNDHVIAAALAEEDARARGGVSRAGMFARQRWALDAARRRLQQQQANDGRNNNNNTNDNSNANANANAKADEPVDVAAKTAAAVAVAEDAKQKAIAQLAKSAKEQVDKAQSAAAAAGARLRRDRERAHAERAARVGEFTAAQYVALAAATFAAFAVHACKRVENDHAYLSRATQANIKRLVFEWIADTAVAFGVLPRDLRACVFGDVMTWLSQSRAVPAAAVAAATTATVVGGKHKSPAGAADATAADDDTPERDAKRSRVDVSGNHRSPQRTSAAPPGSVSAAAASASTGPGADGAPAPMQRAASVVESERSNRDLLAALDALLHEWEKAAPTAPSTDNDGPGAAAVAAAAAAASSSTAADVAPPFVRTSSASSFGASAGASAGVGGGAALSGVNKAHALSLVISTRGVGGGGRAHDCMGTRHYMIEFDSLVRTAAATRPTDLLKLTILREMRVALDGLMRALTFHVHSRATTGAAGAEAGATVAMAAAGAGAAADWKSPSASAAPKGMGAPVADGDDDDDDDDDDDGGAFDNCLVCYVQPREVQILPCGHTVVCRACSGVGSVLARCPKSKCHGKVTSVVRAPTAALPAGTGPNPSLKATAVAGHWYDALRTGTATEATLAATPCLGYTGDLGLLTGDNPLLLLPPLTPLAQRDAWVAAVAHAIQTVTSNATLCRQAEQKVPRTFERVNKTAPPLAVVVALDADANAAAADAKHAKPGSGSSSSSGASATVLYGVPPLLTAAILQRYDDGFGERFVSDAHPMAYASVRMATRTDAKHWASYVAALATPGATTHVQLLPAFLRLRTLYDQRERDPQPQASEHQSPAPASAPAAAAAASPPLLVRAGSSGAAADEYRYRPNPCKRCGLCTVMGAPNVGSLIVSFLPLRNASWLSRDVCVLVRAGPQDEPTEPVVVDHPPVGGADNDRLLAAVLADGTVVDVPLRVRGVGSSAGLAEGVGALDMARSKVVGAVMAAADAARAVRIEERGVTGAGALFVVSKSVLRLVSKWLPCEVHPLSLDRTLKNVVQPYLRPPCRVCS